MSRKAIIAISAIVLVYSIYINNQDGETLDWNFLDSSSEVEEEKEALPVFDNFPQPENGFSPYNDYFGRGVYNNDTGNEFVIKNSNSTDAVVLLVNAFSGKKIRNEYRKHLEDSYIEERKAEEQAAKDEEILRK